MAEQSVPRYRRIDVIIGVVLILLLGRLVAKILSPWHGHKEVVATANAPPPDIPTVNVTAPKRAAVSSDLDATSRMLPMEVQVSNQERTLLPGMYAQVKFSVARATLPLLVPANALVIRSDGPQVAIVQADQTVRYQKVKVERDYGTEVEISTGLNGDETLVVNPTTDLLDGKPVRAVAGQQK